MARGAHEVQNSFPGKPFRVLLWNCLPTTDVQDFAHLVISNTVMLKKSLAFLIGAFSFIASSADLLAPSRNERGDSTQRFDFQFARVQFNSNLGRRSGWAHDYPRAEQNFLTILLEVTKIRTKPDSYSVVRLEDPAIMQYPLLYFSEPGTWSITPLEASNFREYLRRGGFAIFDDFDGPYQWNNFQSCMRQVLPEASLEILTLDHPVFQCFFQIKTLDMIPPYQVADKPIFYGITDEKSGRLQVVVNFNNDIGDYWEWSGNLFYPIERSNE